MCCNDDVHEDGNGDGGCCGGNCCGGSCGGCGCCDDDNNNNNATQQQVDTTTTKPDDGTACGLCRPYRDNLLVASQTLSIVAFSMSWIFWPTMILGGTTMILLQIIWCCRMSSGGLIATIVLSVASALSCLLFAIWALTQWFDKSYCSVFFLDDDYIYNDPNYDYCNEVAWSVVGFLVCAMWSMIAGLLIQFLRSGRYNKCVAESWTRMANRRSATQGGDVELGTMNSNAVEMSPVYAYPDETAATAAAGSGTTTAALASPQAVHVGSSDLAASAPSAAVLPAASYVIENEGNLQGYGVPDKTGA